MNYVSTQFVEYQMYWLLSNYNKFMFVVTQKITPVIKSELEFILALYSFYKIQPVTDTIYYNSRNIKTKLNDTINELLPVAEKEPIIIITCLGDETIEFLKTYNSSDLNIDKSKFPIIITDYNQDMYNEESQQLFKGHYASKIYDRKADYPENIALQNLINTYKGSAEKNINQRFILMYDIFQFLAYAIVNAENDTTVAVKQKMYNSQIDLPDGPKSLYPTNYATSHSIVFHFGANEDEDDIVMNLFYPIGQFPYHFLVYIIFSSSFSLFSSFFYSFLFHFISSLFFIYFINIYRLMINNIISQITVMVKIY